MCTLYENIIRLCKEKGITGGKMCTDIGISKSTLTDLKAGRKKTLTISTASKIADYFGVSVTQVTGGPMSLNEMLYITAKENGMNAAQKLLGETDTNKNAAPKGDAIRVTSRLYTGDENLLSAETLASLSDGETKKPADQKASGLRGTGYYELNPENRAMIDSLIDSLLRSQSAE